MTNQITNSLKPMLDKGRWVLDAITIVGAGQAAGRGTVAITSER